MPFPLAHPAAVLPLRRYCPRYLNFPALVVGSISPDLGYFFRGTGADNFSHSLLGGLGFCLPMGLLALGIFHGFRIATERYFPVFHRRVVLPLAERQPSPVGAVILSLLLGTLTHLLLDSMTHREGWFAQHFWLLQTPLAIVHHRNVRICHLLWYGCSFLGMAWLFLAFRGWQEIQASGRILTPWPKRALEASLVASLLLPIEVVHHLVRGTAGLFLVGALSLAWAAGVSLKVSAPGSLAGNHEFPSPPPLEPPELPPGSPS